MISITRAVSIFLTLLGCLMAQHAPKLEILSSTPLGMPCDGLSGPIATGCMSEDQLGWLVVLKGDGAAYRGTLRYRTVAGEEKESIAITTGEALAFRVGRFWPGGNQFVSLEVSAMKATATLRQDANGAIITVGETKWGPPLVKRFVGAPRLRLADDSAYYDRTEATATTPVPIRLGNENLVMSVERKQK